MSEIESASAASLTVSKKESATAKCPTVYKFLTTQSKSNVVIPDVDPLIESFSSALNRRCAQLDDYITDGMYQANCGNNTSSNNDVI